MAVFFRKGEGEIDPSKLPEGTRVDWSQEVGYGWVHEAGNEFRGFSEGDKIEVRDERWTFVSGERER